jgi:hypothetical protein
MSEKITVISAVIDTLVDEKKRKAMQIYHEPNNWCSGAPLPNFACLKVGKDELCIPCVERQFGIEYYRQTKRNCRTMPTLRWEPVFHSTDLGLLGLLDDLLSRAPSLDLEVAKQRYAPLTRLDRATKLGHILAALLPKKPSTQIMHIVRQFMNALVELRELP